MQIHVVQNNETLAQISQRYSAPIQEIIRANELPNPNQLVVGQAIVIPIVGQFYWIQPGDSLWSVAQRFQMSYQELARINALSANQPLQVGLRLYIPERPRPNAEFNAYVEPSGGTLSSALENSAQRAAPYLTYLSPFAFRAKRDGTLEAPPLGNLRTIAQSYNNILVMVIDNQENGQFSADLGHILLTNEEVQNTFLNNIVSTAQSYGFRDIHFDFEHLFASDREAYTAFLRKAKNRFRQHNWFISTALAPKTSDEQKGQWYEAHDYAAHGEIVDFVVIMTYEWGFSGGPPMAVSPIGPVHDVLNYAITKIPANKILMGQNLYGYDWTLPFTPGKDTAKAISPQQAIRLAVKYGVPIHYDQQSQAPHIDYTDENNRQHKVWFEDARSIQAKFDLLKSLGLRGMSYWKLGLSFPQNWLLIANNFEVVKK
ncbi:LysM peptidoglycan-binding domain-containing protein [Bacillus ginsengihumi]|uniref:LysM peptidoglycan-binding domain-containing protein n=1 Tax=Heyndrickxia ginsengihumi TaxID=363870 RepID=A0A6M0PB62_9BACI|nr:glycoside hydrolase family 18 protein [Heyndrickxia ginsengihumi]MBE6185239.1 LysM peptidoglycan-binding domain-containing protein [Bacillus sp. (in: firmicutes)]NEY21683.1 LysM peptidoglycan-binding domain-containing protein [Heyndrickxia ginsengihumi]